MDILELGTRHGVIPRDRWARGFWTGAILIGAIWFLAGCSGRPATPEQWRALSDSWGDAAASWRVQPEAVNRDGWSCAQCEDMAHTGR